MYFSRHKNALKSSKFVQKRRKILIASTVLSIFCTLLIIINILLLSRLSVFQISDIDVIGTNNSLTDNIKEVIWSDLEGNYFGIIPRSNIIFFPKKYIMNDLISKYKIINDISVKRSGISKIIINIEERMPSAIVCDGFRGDDIVDNCFLSDNKGYIYDKASTSDVNDNSYNTYYYPNSKEDISTGSYFIDKNKFDDLQNFLSVSISNGLVPLGMLIGDNGEYEMYLKNVFSKNASSTDDITVYFDDKKSLKDTLSNLLVFWKDALIKAKSANAPIFDSINLHFGNTVYFSKQNQ